jgi:membrane protease YdiL (CAAX protease family)
MTPANDTVWTWQDLGFFLASVLPSLLLASFCAAWLPGDFGAQALLMQVVLYVLLLSVLFGLARMRHDRELQVATSWTTRFPGVWYYVVSGPLLAILASAVGAALHTPEVPNPIDMLTAGSVPLPIVSLFAVVVGPLFEELFFRGFLQPLLAAHWGSWLGLLGASAGFSLLHGAQTEWHWQYLVILFLVGFVLGRARQKTGSTAAAFMLHMGYNLAMLTAAIAQR